MKLGSIIALAIATLIWQGTTSPSICVVHLESVDYPVPALHARIQGDVPVEVKIDSDGKVVSAHATSGHPLLRQQAEENVKKWTFNSGGERELEVYYEFRLQKPEMNNPFERTIFDLSKNVRVVSNFLAPQG